MRIAGSCMHLHMFVYTSWEKNFFFSLYIISNLYTFLIFKFSTCKVAHLYFEPLQ